jgi:hypothetical protein
MWLVRSLRVVVSDAVLRTLFNLVDGVMQSGYTTNLVTCPLNCMAM